MWWIFGLINVVITLLFTWFFDKYIKKDLKWSLDDKCSFWTLLFLSLIGGYIVTLLFASVLIYLLIDIIKLIKK